MVLPALACVAGGLAIAAEPEPVPLFTTDDLDRMFGPVPAGVSDPVDKSRPEDWLSVEEFIDRQYARIDADREFDLSRRSTDIAEKRVDELRPVYAEPVAWRLGYPASTWWSSVWSKYASARSSSGSDCGEESRHGQGHGHR